MATTRTAVRRGPSGRAPPAHQGPLDGLRAAAAGAVLLTHVGGLTGYTLTGTPASWVLSRGDVGVPIFFSLSGLLLYRRWAAAALTGGRTGAVAVYLRRRALRILPAYWAVVLIALPVLNPGAARHAWPWIQYLLLIQNYDSHPWWSGTGATGLAQAWSLVVEVSFYLILPFLAAALTWFACRGTSAGDVSRRARRLLFGIAALAASSVGWEVLGYYPRPSLWSEGTLPPLLIWFCTGMAMAVALAWAAAEPGPGGMAVTDSPGGVAVTDSPGGVAVTDSPGGVAVTDSPGGVAAQTAPTPRPVLPLGGRLGGHVRPDRRLRLRHRVHPADRTGIRRRPGALGDRVQDGALRPHRRGSSRAGRVPAPAGRPGSRDALRPAAGQPPRPLPGQDLLRHLSVAVPRRLRVLRTAAPQHRVRRGLLHHTRGRGHRGGGRPAHGRRRRGQLLPDRGPGPAAADVRAEPPPGLRQDLAPGR